MQGVVLSGSSARGVRRLARYEHGVLLEESDLREVICPGLSRVTADSLGLDKLRVMLGLGSTRNIELLVPSPKRRIRARGISCHVMSRPLPEHSFQRVANAAEPSVIDLPKNVELFVESPCLSFLSAAAQLDRLVHKGVLGEQEADLRLLKLGVEECSTYVLDPRNPQAGACKFDVEPVLTTSALNDYLDEAYGFEGLARARRVAAWVFDGSASPMETFMYVALSLPTHLGGLGLPQPLVNHALPLEPWQRAILNHTERLTPDLYWEVYLIVLEYLGKEPHEGGVAQDEDMSRIQDYEVLDYRVLPVRYRHVKNPDSFNKLAVRLARLMGVRGGFDAPAWVDELVADGEFLALQRMLFAMMLPPVEFC